MQIDNEAESEVVKKELVKTQQDWISHFNNLGKKMISVPDIYRAAKEEKKALMESFAKNFKERRIITSTGIDYGKGEITHDVESTIVKSKTIKVQKIPDYDWEKVRNDKETENFLQAFFDTKDDIDEILRVMKKYDPKRNLYLWTPNELGRKLRPLRSVCLYFDSFDRFGVGCSFWVDGGTGLSRGVSVPSAKQTQFFSNKAVFDIEEKKITIPMENKIRKGIERKLKLK